MKFVLLLLAAASLDFANVCSGEEAEKEWTLVLLTEAAKQGALCLDGTTPGYYFRSGYGSGADKWHLHLKGGALCTGSDLQKCSELRENGKSSSELWPPYLPFPNTSKEVLSWKMGGILSGNRSVNPDFYNWNTAYIMSCDRTEFASNLEYPVRVPAFTSEGGQKIDSFYYRGQKILQANLEEILKRGMKDASEVILGGGSTGAQSVYIHADHVGQLLPSHIRYSAIADAGFFLDHQTVDGDWDSRREAKLGTRTQNRTGALDQDCLDAYSEEEAWMCHFPQYNYPYISTPMFIIQSKYDTVGIAKTLKAECTCQYNSYCMAKCSDEETEAIHGFSEDLAEAVAEPVRESPTDGMFVDTCLTHSQSLRDSQWTAISVNGQTIQETVGIWYHGREGNSKVVEEGQFPCNPSCTTDITESDSSLCDKNTQPDDNEDM